MNEVCEVCSYHRKHAIRRISQWRANQGQAAPRKRRRRGKLYPPEVMRIIEKVWEVAGYPWSVRLKEILRLWLPWIRRRFGLREAQEKMLLAVSPSTIDRALRDKKRQLRRYGWTKPGTLLRRRIEVRCEHWDAKEPGYVNVKYFSHLFGKDIS